MWTKPKLSFVICNTAFLALVATIALAPVARLLAVSFSSNVYALSGDVTFWPIGFNLTSYEKLLGDSAFFSAVWIAVKRLALGSAINLTLCVLTAYPLSKGNEEFRARTLYVWIIAFTMFFSGGLVPSYIVVSKLGLKNSIWALILPGAVPVGYVVMMLNFFRGVPKSLEEAAMLDGASHLKVLVKVYLPISLPSLATITLFVAVGHWNSWFDGYIYMSRPANYPLATFLYDIVQQFENLGARKTISIEQINSMLAVGTKTLQAAQMFIAMVPIVVIYPFLQKFFIKGIVLGAVKE